jgi:hypothetical protein
MTLTFHLSGQGVVGRYLHKDQKLTNKIIIVLINPNSKVV